MMKSLSRLAPRDLDALSAYLDGALPDDERLELERRLEREIALQEALRELRTASALLRALPQVRPPHNFTLTPEMAGLRPGWLRTPILQLATAVAALALVVTIGVDVLLGQAMPGNALRAAAPAPEMLMQAPAEVAEGEAVGAMGVPSATEESVALDQAPDAVVAAAPAESGVTEKVAIGETPEGGAVEPLYPTPTASMLAEEYASRQEAPALAGAAVPPSAPAPAPTATPMPEASAPTHAGCPVCGPDVILPTVAPSRTPVSTPAPDEGVAQQAPQPSPDTPTGERSGLPLIRQLEIGLVVAVVILGSATLWARRRAR